MRLQNGVFKCAFTIDATTEFIPQGIRMYFQNMSYFQNVKLNFNVILSNANTFTKPQIIHFLLIRA